MLGFNFRFLEIFSNLFMIFFLWSIGSKCFIFTFLNFPFFLLLLISGFIPLHLEKVPGMISILKKKLIRLVFWWTCNLPWRIFHVCLRLFFRCLFCMSVKPFGPQCSNMQFLYWCFIWFFDPLLKLWNWFILLLLYCCLFLPLIQSICFRVYMFLYIFRCPDSGCIHMCNCYIFLLNWLLTLFNILLCLLWQLKFF